MGDARFIISEEVDGHIWGVFTGSSMLLGGQYFEVCRNCGMVRRKDKANKPCRGVVKIALRDTDEAAMGGVK